MPLIIPGNSQASTGYTIDQSIRFNDDDSAYMSRTFSASNRKTLTFSCWVKRGTQGTNQNIFGPETSLSGSGTYGVIRLNPQNELDIFDYTNGTTNWRLQSTQLLRDSSAWYHFVFSMDTSNAVSSERLRMYINGERVTDFDVETYPSLNYEGQWNNNLTHQIGAIQRGTSNQYFDGYLAEIHFLDGYAYDPSYFGETTSEGIWIPKEYSGSYGTNGFKIDGRDASDLGDDESGNGNDFTTSGLASHDQVSDSPSNNFCTGLPIGVGNATGVTFSDGNLTGKTSGTAGNWVGSISLSSGKWYFEVNNHANGSGNGYGVGETPEGSYHHFALGSGGNQINDYSVYKGGNSSGDIVGFKLDFDAGTLSHTLDGTSYSSTGSLTSNMAYAVYSRLGSSSGHVVFNFGQDSTFGGLETAGSNSDSNGIGDFYYNVPSGFSAICTKNLGS